MLDHIIVFGEEHLRRVWPSSKLGPGSGKTVWMIVTERLLFKLPASSRLVAIQVV
jgi:hypothetical protein